MDTLGRKRILAEAIQRAVIAGGRVESQSDTNAVLVTGRPVRHVLHAVVGFFTSGVWWIVWFFFALSGGERRHILDVNASGHLDTRNLGRRDGNSGVIILSGVLALVGAAWVLLLIVAVANA